MHAWKHWLMGAGFFGFGTFKLLTGGSPWLVGLCAIAAGYLFYRAYTEQTGEAAQDLELAVSFVRNPTETVFDEVVARLDQRIDQASKDQPGLIQSFVSERGLAENKPAEPPAFDPDAAIARYLANRPAPEPAPLARPQGFGRKRA